MMPSISACLIVRDEQDRLAACLESVRPLVAEVIVCDTGSSDGTAALAERLGAVVTTTRWTDDFAAARNAALAACMTDWVLSIDADELLLGERAWLRAMLAAAGDDLDALSVEIDNSSAPDNHDRSAHRELKLFRRECCRWSGRVHERVVSLDGTPLRAAHLPARTARLVHHGYDDPVDARAKGIRNARLAALELADRQRAGADTGEVAEAALDLGRSLLAAGRPDLASAPLLLARRDGSEATRQRAEQFGPSGRAEDLTQR